MVSEGQNMTITPTADPSAPCWKDGCREVRANLGTYYCATHDRERRDRIARSMAEAAEGVAKAAAEASQKIADFAEAISERCQGTVASGARCRRRKLVAVNAGGYMCPQHAWQDGVEEGSK